MKPRLSIVIPAHNSGMRLERTLEELQEGLGRTDIEVIIVENGSGDDTWQVAQRVASGTHPFPVMACQSPVGLGAAYQEGIRRAQGATVLLTADDLPFGLSDIRSWEQVDDADAVVIGSKAHPDSQVARSVVRSITSLGFRILRLLTLGMRVADCQGTIFAPREWLAAWLPQLRENGYLASTEIVYLAQIQDRRIVEMPVQLSSSHEGGKTRIRFGDIYAMAIGLVSLRRRRAALGGR